MWILVFNKIRFHFLRHCSVVYVVIVFVQLLYAGEGEARRPDDGSLSQLELSVLRDDKPGTIGLKGHEFVQISYHMPTNCEACPRPLWHMFRPPPALECRRKWTFLGVVHALAWAKNILCAHRVCLSVCMLVCYFITTVESEGSCVVQQWGLISH